VTTDDTTFRERWHLMAWLQYGCDTYHRLGSGRFRGRRVIDLTDAQLSWLIEAAAHGGDAGDTTVAFALAAEHKLRRSLWPAKRELGGGKPVKRKPEIPVLPPDVAILREMKRVLREMARVTRLNRDAAEALRRPAQRPLVASKPRGTR